jgi:cation diffusion facilitator CzcD-associated flavoprotein CzcO
MRVVVVGAGFAGIGMAVTLMREGVRDLVVLEKSDDVGGVWRDNTYPGAACDVPSHLYSFSFAPEGRWSKRFAEQSEILAYLRRTAEELGVLPLVRFGAEVAAADWDDGARTWTVTLATGESLTADVLVTGVGQLSRPAYPDVPGLEDFAGTVFHSARWNHDHDLRGEKVVVLGTGASAIQFVPEVVKVAGHVTVLQRTAPWVVHKPDRDYGPGTKAALARFPLLLKADRLRTYLVNEARTLGFNTEPRLMRGHELRALRALKRQVPDPELRAKLTPHDQIGCKRILQSDDWYPALTRPNVDVVTEKVTRVVPTGVETADGVVHEADAIVMGTGFATTDLLAPMEITARGRSLHQAWERGAEGYLGTMVAGFPNLFVLYGPNTNLGHNSIILMLESQFRFVREALRTLRGGGSLEVRPQAQARYNDWLQRRLARTVFATGCRSWYLTPDGRNTLNWPGSTLEFRLRTRRLHLQDLEVRR